MGKSKTYIIIAVLLACAFCALGESAIEDDKAAALEAKHGETVMKTIQMLARYGCDNASISKTTTYFQKNTDAWYFLERFDGGWFSTISKQSFGNFRAENWEYVSEDEFCVDAYCDYSIGYKYSKNPETFPCAYHFCFRKTVANKDFWQVYDFHNLPNEADALEAEKLTAESEGISVYAVTGRTFTGFMTVVDDPSRIYVGTINSFGKNSEGVRINALCEKYGAVGGINGGGFSDNGGKGNGGIPYGIVVSQGVQKRGHTPSDDGSSTLIGFDADNKLIVGTFTVNEVKQMNLRDALAFHPALVANGEALATPKERVSFTVRTAIGQDADGRVLMLVVRGRQPDSLGANMADLSQVMLEYGAVTAGNLDGGSSTCLYLNDTSVYSGFRLDVSRRIPAGFLIRPIE